VDGDDYHEGSFEGCTRLDRVVAPDALVKGDMADPARALKGWPALATGLTPSLAAKLSRRRLWHPIMHAWCTAARRACVVSILVARLRVNREEDPRLPSPPIELWLPIFEFAPRRELRAPPPPVV